MKRLTLLLAITIFAVAFSNAQTVPAKVTSSLNHFYKGWRQAPGKCDSRKWFLTGDFDGNGRRDYLVRFTTGKTTKSMRLNLVAFLSFDDGSYQPKHILDDRYSGDLKLNSSFSVAKKGTKIQLGEGEGPTITLANDAASQYVCQTDAVKTLVFENGKWRNIYDE